MKPIPEKYANRPHLWWAARELSKLKYSYKVLDALLALDKPREEKRA